MPDLPDEPATNEPIPTPANDETGIVSGNEPEPGEPTSPAELPLPEVDPDAERDVPGDLDDGPLVA